MSLDRKLILFEARGRFFGIVEWMCPFCGHSQRSRVRAALGYEIRCTDRNCKRVLGIGLRFIIRERTNYRQLPPDYIVPLERGRVGECVNQIEIHGNGSEDDLSSDLMGTAP